MRRAVIMIDPGGAIGKLHCVRLAQENHSCGIELADYCAVFRGDVILQQMRTGGCRDAFHVEKIFGGVRDAVKGSQTGAILQCHFCSPGLSPCMFRHDADKRMEPPVEFFDPAEEFFDNLCWAELAATNAARQADN